MERYTCPMHPQIQQDKEGKCPICGMRLIRKDKSSEHNSQASYVPLIVIVSIILLAAMTICFATGFSLRTLITNFMIGFFLVFSGFKLMDLKGFARGYETYDLLAKNLFWYGYFYPFIELFFALAMIMRFELTVVLIAEVVVMLFSGLGVAIKLARHEKFQCACLGTFLKVPLTKVTLVEDFGMAFLAILLLLIK